jgi:hypothetical protein
MLEKEERRMAKYVTDRDKLIMDGLSRFRVMSRDDIEGIYFNDLEAPRKACNRVMLRLREKGYALAEEQGLHNPYLYHPNPRRIRAKSKKTKHYLGIVKVFRDLKNLLPTHIRQDNFTVEPRYTGYNPNFPQPDAVFTVCGHTFFLEYQIQHYNRSIINRKMNRYHEMYRDREFLQETFQTPNPTVWMYAEGHSYAHKLNPLRMPYIETGNVVDFVECLLPILLEEGTLTR